ncbi:MAG: type II toxin-antitoxin system YafQ family toxin [Caulobacteraceae bacterium]|nr:type II toxin-antitoxin system YafQ family toxin [Caulobacter sp.]
MLTPVTSGRFRRDVKAAERRGKDLEKLREAITRLAEQAPLPAAYGDHPLKGVWSGYRDLHLEPDWLLLYRVSGDELLLARTGTHADLFG